MALRILVESFWAIFGNIGQAFRVSILPLVVVNLCAFIMVSNLGTAEVSLGDLASLDITSLTLLLGLGLIAVCIFVMAWVAVAWHRLVLREERSGVLPITNGRSVWPYVGQSVVIWLPTALTAFVGLFALTFLVAVTLGPASTDRLGGILNTVSAVVCLYLWLRWGMALVGIAIEKPMGMREAWRATRSLRSTILGVAVLIVAVNRIAEQAITAAGNAPQLVDLFFDASLGWITVMLGISVLTTLYGYCVEGRH